MANKPTAEELAYEAGRACYAGPAELRHPDSCPFGPGPERDQWLAGFGDALEEAATPDELRKALKEAAQ